MDMRQRSTNYATRPLPRFRLCLLLASGTPAWQLWDPSSLPRCEEEICTKPEQMEEVQISFRLIVARRVAKHISAIAILSYFWAPPPKKTTLRPRRRPDVTHFVPKIGPAPPSHKFSTMMKTGSACVGETCLGFHQVETQHMGVLVHEQTRGGTIPGVSVRTSEKLEQVQVPLFVGSCHQVPCFRVLWRVQVSGYC